MYSLHIFLTPWKCEHEDFWPLLVQGICGNHTVSVTFLGVIMPQQVCTSSMLPMCNTGIYNVLHDVIKIFILRVICVERIIVFSWSLFHINCLHIELSGLYYFYFGS